MKRSIAPLSVCAIVTAASSAVIVVPYSPTGWDADLAAMDAKLGITGFVIEDFEDEILLPGLMISAESYGPTNTLPTVDLDDRFPNANWDGTRSFLPTVREQNNDLFPVVIYLPGDGVMSVGIGLGDIESPVELMVNGVSYGVITDYPEHTRSDDNTREIYFRIAGTSGELITTVGLNPILTGPGDGVFIDHLAISRDCLADLNNDGVLDLTDIGIFIDAFLNGCP